MPQNQLEPEFATAFTQWQTRPTQATRSQLLRQLNPVIDQAITSYGAGSQGSSTLRSHARLMALNALRTYDATKGTLRTHLLSQLRGLQRIGARQQQVISVPERVSLDRQRLITAETELRDRFGRDPSDAEIADYTGLSLKRLAHVRQGRPPVAQGTITDSGNPDAFTPASRIPGQDPGYAAWIEFVYGDLDPINQAIMDYALGLHGTPRIPATEIARRLGLTAGAVSQRAAKIQAMLDERQTLRLL